MIGKSYEYTKMSEVESKHWWYKSLHDLTVKTLELRFKKNYSQINILDAGCGTGGLMEILNKHGYKNLQGFDLSDHAVKIAQSKGLSVKIDDLTTFEYQEDFFDVIISHDTLCYFNNEEQKKVLIRFNHLLKKNGVLIMNVPALDVFSGIHDKAVGIKNRFNIPSIFDIINSDNFNIIERKYWPFSLSPIIFFIRTFQRFQLNFKKDIKIKSDIDLPSDVINNILYKVVSFENKFLVKKPFGSSLFLVLQKK